MKTKQSLKSQSLGLVIGLALSAALWATPGTARGQMFVSVNANPFTNGGSYVYQYDPTGPTGTPAMPPFLSNLDHPREVAFDSAGNLYVATFTWLLDSEENIIGTDHGSILKVSGGVAGTLATFHGASAHGLVIDNAGNVFASSQNFDGTQSTIYKVTFDGTAPDGTVSTFGSVPGQCFGLALNSGGNLFAAGSDDTLTYGSIYKFTPLGARSIFVGAEAFSSGPGPAGLTFDTSGNLFASTTDSNSNGEIRRFDPSGTEITPQFATGLTKTPRGLAFDSDGNLFLAEIGVPGTAITGDILKFTPGGSVASFDDGATGDFGTRGNRGPEYLAFAPPAAVVPPVSTAVVLTFPNTTEPLTTTVVASLDQNSVPLPSPNFELTESNLAFEITTPTEPTPPIIIAFTVPQSVLDQCGCAVLTLKALHYENGNWVDSTIYPGDPNYPTNAASNTVYASVNHLSPFLVAKFRYAAQVQQPVNANGASVFNVRRGVIPVKFTLTNNGSSTCTLPPATIAVTRTAGGTTGAINESVYSGSADNGSNFRIVSCQYVYNLNSSALGVGTYRVDAKVNGTVVGSATFQLK